MFTTMTASGVVTQATTWAAAITGVALVVVGLGVAKKLTGWVIGKIKGA